MSAAVSSGLLPTTQPVCQCRVSQQGERPAKAAKHVCASGAQQSWQLKGDKSLGDKIPRQQA